MSNDIDPNLQQDHTVETHMSPDISQFGGNQRRVSTSLPIHFIHSFSLPTVWATRKNELGELFNEIRANRYQVISVIAMGGTGKSTLVCKMLEELPQKGVALDSCLWFSFYAESDVDLFLTEACSYLIPSFDPHQYPRPFAKSGMLREILTQKRCLIILDGLETMLETDQKSPRYGTCKDRVLRDFLIGMCSKQENSQVFITSRCPLTDLTPLEGYRELHLSDLAPEAAGNYMVNQGIKGTRQIIDQVCAHYGYHVLTLYVLADYLTQPPHYGNIKGVKSLRELPIETPQGAKLHSILEGYWHKLTLSEQLFMERLSAFRANAPEAASKLLAFDDNGDRCDVDHPVFHRTLRRLNQSSLLEIEQRGNGSFYVAHPLIKDYFYRQLQEEERQTIHLEIKLFAAGIPIPDKPRTLEELDWWLELHYHAIHAKLYDDAHDILRSHQTFDRVFWWGHYILLVEMLQSLLDAYDKGIWSPTPTIISRVLGDMANNLSKSGNAEFALTYHRRAAEVAQGNLVQQSEEWQYLSELLGEMGRFTEALQILEHAQEIEAQLQRPAQAYLVSGRAGYYNAALGQVQEAEEQLTRAIELCKDETSYEGPVYLCLYLRIRGDLYVCLGRFPQAYDDYSQGLEIARDPEKDFKDYEGHILRGLGDLYRLQRQYDEATDAYQKAYALAKNIGYIWLEAEVESGLALLTLATGLVEEAADHAKRAIEVVGKAGWLVQQIQAYIVLARVSLVKGNLEEAKQYVEVISPLLDVSKHFWLRKEVEDIMRIMNGY